MNKQRNNKATTETREDVSDWCGIGHWYCPLSCTCVCGWTQTPPLPLSSSYPPRRSCRVWWCERQRSFLVCWSLGNEQSVTEQLLGLLMSVCREWLIWSMMSSSLSMVFFSASVTRESSFMATTKPAHLMSSLDVLTSYRLRCVGVVTQFSSADLIHVAVMTPGYTNWRSLKLMLNQWVTLPKQCWFCSFLWTFS